ncbi:hypothetical protein KGF57_000120 [Candida theae]|uniref:Ubiquitin-like protease family profile domain-containing protein n=1 Tax=Candida theae TaxID=1198502 RepID=A0AAD5BK26_9ASCO|nr:uncharacterized protein KGF57_000120 [Candida theae]KAI5968426.1 hypothetical protein KGF57_000120 [Candida theae]
MTSSNLKTKQFPSLIKKRTSSPYGAKPVDNLYKREAKSPNSAATRNFDSNIASNTPKPQSKSRQTSLSNLLHGATKGHAAHKTGDPLRKRLDSLNSKTVEIIDLDKAEKDNESIREITSNGSSHTLSSSDPNQQSYQVPSKTHSAGGNDSFDSRPLHPSHSPAENDYSQKIEASSRIRERLDSLTSRTDRLLESKNAYTPKKKELKRTLVSPEPNSSEKSLLNSRNSLSPSSEKQQESKSRQVSSSTSTPSISVSPSPASSAFSEPEFSIVEDCGGNNLNVKRCGLNESPKVRDVLKSFHYHGQKVKKRSQRVYEIAVSSNGEYIYIGWRHPSLDLVPLNKFVIDIDSQLKDFSFANESYIMQLAHGKQIIIASHYGRDSEIRDYFTKHPNSKVKVGAVLTEVAVERLMERANSRAKSMKNADPLANAAFQRPRRSSPRVSQKEDGGIEDLGDLASEDDEGLQFFSGTDYDDFEPIPKFQPALHYKFHEGREITVSASDFSTLHRNYWVNDVIIDFGLKYIVQEGVKKGLVASSEIFSFNSFFYTKLTSGAEKGASPEYYKNIKRWLSKINLMEIKYLIIPVNTGSHWFCCIIRNLPGLLESARAQKAAKKEPIDLEGPDSQIPPTSKQHAEIFVLDSLGNKRYDVSVPLKSFIIDYCKEKFDIEIKRDQIRFQSARVPRQNNLNDCGVHVLYNVRKWLSNISECESFFKKHSYAQAKVLFPAEERKNERKYWTNLLLDLHRAQNRPHDNKAETVDDDNDDDCEIVENSTVKEKVLSQGASSFFTNKPHDNCDDDKVSKGYRSNHKSTGKSPKDSDTLEIAEFLKDDATKPEKKEVRQVAAQESGKMAASDKNASGSNAEGNTFEGVESLSNLVLRKQFEDVQLPLSLCELLNQYFPETNTPIKKVRLVVIKTRIQKALTNPSEYGELEKLLKLFAKDDHQRSKGGTEAACNLSTSSNDAPFGDSVNNGEVTSRIGKLRLGLANEQPAPDEPVKINTISPIITSCESDDEEWKGFDEPSQKPRSQQMESQPRGFNASKKDFYSGNKFPKTGGARDNEHSLYKRGGFGNPHGHFRKNNLTNSRFGFGTEGLKKNGDSEFCERKKAARDLVEADGYETVTHSDRGYQPSEDSDVVLDFPAKKSAQFWNKILRDYSNQWVTRHEVDKVETEILKGIPSEYRAPVYLKTLQVRYKFTQNNTFDELLRQSTKLREETVSKLSKEQEVVELVSLVLVVLEGSEASASFANDVAITRYLVSCAELLAVVPNFSREQRFFVLFKLYKSYSLVKQEEFVYKINRALEDKLGSFKHLVSQGVNLSAYYKKLVPELIYGMFGREEASFRIFDLIVFEGFDFLLRLIAWAFLKNDNKLASLSGDELLTFMQSQEFLSEPIDFGKILKLELPLITYENEFYLMEANSLSNNTNELRNLSEVHDELLLKIDSMKVQIKELQSTHTEISQQSEEYNENLMDAEVKRKDLIAEKERLQKKYEHLTMKENLANTIKANEEFSQRNVELQHQIEALKKSIGDKKHRLSKAVVNSQ